MINNRWKKVERSDKIYLPTLNKQPIISKNTKVCLIGSCFADDMGWVLAEKNINIGKVDYLPDIKQVAYPWGTFFSPMSIADILEITLNQKTEDFFDDESLDRKSVV